MGVSLISVTTCCSLFVLFCLLVFFSTLKTWSGVFSDTKNTRDGVIHLTVTIEMVWNYCIVQLQAAKYVDREHCTLFCCSNQLHFFFFSVKESVFGDTQTWNSVLFFTVGFAFKNVVGFQSLFILGRSKAMEDGEFLIVPAEWGLQKQPSFAWLLCSSSKAKGFISWSLVCNK